MPPADPGAHRIWIIASPWFSTATRHSQVRPVAHPRAGSFHNLPDRCLTIKASQSPQLLQLSNFATCHIAMAPKRRVLRRPAGPKARAKAKAKSRPKSAAAAADRRGPRGSLLQGTCGGLENPAVKLRFCGW
eukprot:Skav201071  [mRNA]  locus=scaffold963:31839:32234:+ [translate_table: standard]